MIETINLNTCTFANDIEKLHQEHERTMRKFVKYKSYFDYIVKELIPDHQNVVRDLLKTANKNGMKVFKEHLPTYIRKNMRDELSLILFPEMEESMLLNKVDQIERYKLETSQFLIRYAGLYVGYCNLMQVFYDREEFNTALGALSERQYVVCRRFQDPGNVHVSDTEEREEIIESLSSAIDNISSELGTSKYRTISLLQYHYDFASNMA